MANLEQIHRGDSARPAIVFVHGLGGDLFDTWVGPGTSRDDFWLNWVGQDTDCDTWTLGYDSALSRWQNQAMPLPDQGTQVAQLLAVHAGLKDRNIVLVGHSMGGLVIKTLITQSLVAGDARARGLVGRIRGVVFVATPHQGSQLASLAKAVAAVLRTNAQVGDMSRHDSHLRQLGAAFREQRRALQLKVAAFAEGRDVIWRQTGWLGFWTRQVGVRVVDPSSSDLALEGVTTVPLAEDHFSICKPSSRDAQVHHALVAFIKEEILAQSHVGGAPLAAPMALPPPTAAPPARQSACERTEPIGIVSQRSEDHLYDGGDEVAQAARSQHTHAYHHAPKEPAHKLSAQSAWPVKAETPGPRKSMLLLHISDIHFRAPECTQENDPNRAYRTRMIQDARTRARALGGVDAILVGGDIAYRAAPSEYAAASTWLEQLAKESGCPLERIFVVPGNHDVDRGLISRSRQVRNIHKAIRDASPAHRYRELQAQLGEAATGRALFEPLAAYNEFAARFNCQVFHDRLAWKQDLVLGPGMTLRIHGFTSTLLSGAVTDGGQDDKQLSLYLSPWQTALLEPDPNTVNLVMAHHPPDWLMDQDEVEDAVHGRAAIHLWGHKHRQRITRDEHYIRLAAGAVNPDAGEPGWHPAYNLIELAVHGFGPDRALHVAAHLLEWQTNPERYRSRQDAEGREVFRHVIRCPCDDRPPRPAAAVPSAGLDLVEVLAVAAQVPDVEAAMGEKSTRNLVIRWWGLPMAARRDIALRLGLISEDEVSLPEPERYGRALLRAKERDQLEQIAKEIDKWQME